MAKEEQEQRLELAERAARAEESRRALADKFATTQAALASKTKANQDADEMRNQVKRLERERGEIAVAFRDVNSRVQDMEIEAKSMVQENALLKSDLKDARARLEQLDSEHQRQSQVTRDEARMLEAVQTQARGLEARLSSASASLELSQKSGAGWKRPF